MRSQTCLKVRAPVELSAQITHEIVPILSRRKTREIEVFRENSHVFRLPTRQASHQTLLRRLHSRDGQPITMELTGLWLGSPLCLFFTIDEANTGVLPVGITNETPVTALT